MAWVPLSIVWFGLGEGPTVFLIFMSAVFPLTINTIAGIAGIILSIPIATILLIMYREYALPWFDKRKNKLNGIKEALPPDTEEPETENNETDEKKPS